MQVHRRGRMSATTMRLLEMAVAQGQRKGFLLEPFYYLL